MNFHRMAAALFLVCCHSADRTEEWTGTQQWMRDSPGPVVSLGEAGSFDDMHIFAPCVALEKGVYSLWYCGSRGEVATRVFELGMATSTDGVHFTKEPSPVFSYGDGKHSVLTPTLLRGEDGAVLRDDGALRMWFSATDFANGGGLHTLHETRSVDGKRWDSPSPAQLEHAYAPTVIKDGAAYLLWYTDVSNEPWVIRHARSNDGKAWRVVDEASIVLDQAWEERRLFYPCVVKSGGTYCMWYGAYWSARPNTTAIGFATSRDGVTWRKHVQNPVLMPDPDRPWESHYTTSQSVLRLPDGAWRMWYATRKEPPFVNKYFAIGTARWEGSALAGDDAAWPERSEYLRKEMRSILTLPAERVELDARTHQTLPGDGITIESVSYAAEPGSRVTALLYLPDAARPVPAVVVACGHGGSKSALYAQYAGQLYAKRGIACLVPDTIGEEERNTEGRMGARGHDLYRMKPEERLLFERRDFPRSILGKIVLDLSRGVDYLETRHEVDASRIGVMGYSLGGASAGCLAILDDRIRAAVIAGWGFTPLAVGYGKECTRLPYEDFKSLMRWGEMTALLAPHAATLFINGEHDTVIDKDENGAALVRHVREGIQGAREIWSAAGLAAIVGERVVEGACHRPYFLTPDGVRWVETHLGMPEAQLREALPVVKYGDWVEKQGQSIEKLYDTEERERGAVVVDVNAVYRTPGELSCFPGLDRPSAEYTFEGWVEYVLLANRKDTVR
ncbi:MAG: hypothetical protein AMXMBFR84_19120 [Candidatus Hydrogenedentota bacterium]